MGGERTIIPKKDFVSSYSETEIDCLPSLSLYKQTFPFLIPQYHLCVFNLPSEWVGGFRKSNPSNCFFPNALISLLKSFGQFQKSLYNIKYLKPELFLSKCLVEVFIFSREHTGVVRERHFMPSWAELKESSIIFATSF